jgi:hypothetical protein
MTERFTFADSVTGLTTALETTLTLRSHGFRTRLETTTRTVGSLPPFTLHTVVATPLPRARTAFQKLNSELNR